MVKRFVAVWFPYLITDWFAICNVALRNKPYVVRIAVRGRMMVAASSPAAQQQGIHPNMVLADARAILPSLQVFDEKPALAENLLKRLALWSIRFTPFAAADLPDGLLLDATGCPHLWGGDEAYLKEIIQRLEERGYHVRAAMADTIGAAWALSRYNNSSTVCKPGEQATALLHLSSASLRLEADATERLYKLGFYTVKDFLHLPRQALRRRFGTHLLLRLDQALGREEENFQPVQTIEPYQERLPSLDPIITTKGIEIALERLLQAICTRLQREQKGLRTAIFKAYQINGGMAQVVIETSGPSSQPKHLYRLFEIKLPIIQPESGIELFVLEAKGIAPHVAGQESLWEGTLTLMDVRLAELLDRLALKFGANCIHRFLPDEHHWPERSFRPAQALSETTNTLWKTDRPRPVLLLPKPEKVDVTAPIPDYPPMLFRYREKLHKIARADGPERIEQEWWIEEGEHRDYYHVEDEEGQRYWLFRLGHYDPEKKGQWYVHGYFA